ncbi:MAG: hypothetical protein P4K80_04420 [Acidobacteriaceae bacterium]|nr:hypothetical protein [Acidobacteriaceae bacterium]
MKLCSKILAIAIIASTTYAMVGCAAPSGFSYQNVTVTLSPQCSDCAGNIYSATTPTTLMVPTSGTEGSCTLFNAIVANAPATNVQWSLYPTPNLYDPTIASSTGTPAEGTSAVGNFANGLNQTAVGPSAMWCSPSGRPVWTGAALAQANAMQYTVNGVPQTGIPQGDILLAATVPIDPSDPTKVDTAYQLIQYYSSIALTLTPGNISIPLGGTYQFTGFGVAAGPCAANVTTPTTECYVAPTNDIPYAQYYPTGTPINSVTWDVGPNTSGAIPEVGGVMSAGHATTTYPAGSTTWGTISQTGLYTAPTVAPSTYPLVTLVANVNGSTVSTATVTFCGLNTLYTCN